MKYPAKRDFGGAVAIVVLVSAFAGFGLFFIVSEGPNGNAAAIGGGILLLLTALLWAWFWFGTSYEIRSSHVHIRLGPIRWRVKLDEIVEAVPTSSVRLMLGGPHARFALSKDAVMIKASGNMLGFLPHTVLISPQDRSGFLKTLAEAWPDLQLSDDRSVRRRTENGS